jgi:prepilin-type N-terminal cleavage/methylation domain-containing protein
MRNDQGVTLIELLIVIMIIGLLTTAALKAYDTSLQAGRFRTTMRVLDEIAMAIVGNPDLVSAGVRSDYGYVSDIGSLPLHLQDLTQRPAGIDPNLWHGPYLIVRVAENPQGYMIDGWGDSLIYDRDSLAISSRRGMSILQPDSWITRKLARNSADLFRNDFGGIIYDAKGNPPTPTTDLTVVLDYPRNGQMASDTIHPGVNGNFQFAGRVTVGNHDLRVRLITPVPETIWVARNVSVTPGGGGRNWAEVHLPVPF